MKIKRFLLICTVLFLLITVLQNVTLSVARYSIISDKIPAAFSDYKILQLSDLHSAQFGRGNKNLLRRIEKLAPDVILITGDMINSSNDDGSLFIPLIENLGGKYPVYFICGNHELLVSEYNSIVYESYIDRLKKLGVHILNDESVSLNQNDFSIVLYGYQSTLQYYNNRNDLKAAGKDLTVETLVSQIGSPNPLVFNILLAHDPIYADVYAEWGADAVLSGHVHGGVVRLPFFGGVLSPDGSFFPKFDKGQYTVGATQLIVSGGLGNSVIPFRIFNAPQMVMITVNP